MNVTLFRGLLVWLFGCCLAGLFMSHAIPAQSAEIKTSKEVYAAGETIVVSFSGAPGYARDWICIVPKSAPDNDAGEYEYTGYNRHQGTLSFSGKPPGDYEARAYFDYSRLGYVVTVRHAFKVIPKASPGAADVYQRSLQPSRPEEARVPKGKAFIYLYREPLFITKMVDARVQVQGKPFATIPASSFTTYIAKPGPLAFTCQEVQPADWTGHGPKEPVRTSNYASAQLEVKGGKVYYVKLSVTPGMPWQVYLEQVPWQTGERAFIDYRMSPIKP